MKQYYPCALGMTQRGSVFRLFSYDSTLSINEAWNAIKTWKGTCTLLNAWVQDYDHNLCGYECYVDSLGEISYKGTKIE